MAQGGFTPLRAPRHKNKISIEIIKMPYVRKRSMRKRTRKTTRKFNITRKKAKVNTLTTKRYQLFQVVTGNDLISSTGGGQFFKLNDLTNSSEFTNLFDQYMITGIQYRFVTRINPDIVTTVTNRGVYPVLRWVHDHDDVTSPSSATELYQYPAMREFNFTSDKNCTRWMYLKPALANEVFGTVVQTAYAPKWRQWCDCNYAGIQHYGIKYYADNCYSGQSIYLECKYILKFRGVM